MVVEGLRLSPRLQFRPFLFFPHFLFAALLFADRGLLKRLKVVIVQVNGREPFRPALRVQVDDDGMDHSRRGIRWDAKPGPDRGIPLPMGIPV